MRKPPGPDLEEEKKEAPPQRQESEMLFKLDSNLSFDIARPLRESEKSSSVEQSAKFMSWEESMGLQEDVPPREAFGSNSG